MKMPRYQQQQPAAPFYITAASLAWAQAAVSCLSDLGHFHDWAAKCWIESTYTEATAQPIRAQRYARQPSANEAFIRSLYAKQVQIPKACTTGTLRGGSAASTKQLLIQSLVRSFSEFFFCSSTCNTPLQNTSGTHWDLRML